MHGIGTTSTTNSIVYVNGAVPDIASAGGLSVDATVTSASFGGTAIGATISTTVQAATAASLTGLSGVATSTNALIGVNGRLTGVYGYTSYGGTGGTLFKSYAGLFGGEAFGTGTVTNFNGIEIDHPDITGSGVITNNVALDVRAQTQGTNNTYILLGQDTAAAGQWGIYNSSANDNAFAGKLRVGSVVAPTVALDVTGAAKISTDLNVDTDTLYVDSVNNRVAIGNTNTTGSMFHIYGSPPNIGGGSIEQVEGPLTSTTNSQTGLNVSPSVAVTTNLDYYGIRLTPTASGIMTTGSLTGIYDQLTYSGTSTLGVATAGQFRVDNTSTGTITNSTAAIIQNAINSGGGAITSSVGLSIYNQTTGGAGTNNTNLNIGGAPPAGNYSIYNASAYQNVMNGNLRVGGTTNPVATLDVTGSISATGLITGTLGATITGAATSINASSNFATNINTGTSTGAISVGNAAAGVITVQSASTIGLTGTTTVTGLTTGDALTVSNSTSTGNIFVAKDNNTAVFTVEDGGDVGLSVTPAANVRLTIDNNATGESLLRLNNNGSQIWLVQSNGGLDISPAANNQNLVAIRNLNTNIVLNVDTITDVGVQLGRIGVNTSAPTASLDVQGSASANSVVSFIVNNNVSTGDIARFQDGGTTVFKIADGGNVTFSGNLIPGAASTYDIGTTTAEVDDIYLADNNGLRLGLDQDALLAYDEATDDRVELTGTGASLFVEDRLALGVQTLTLTDDGTANDTLTPTATYVRVDVNETANAGVPDLVLSEASAKDGDLLIIVNNEQDGSHDTFTITESAGVYETSALAAIGPNDSITFIYMNYRWVQLSYSNN